MVGAGSGVERPVRVWSVPSSHENDCLPWTDRQALRRACNDTELEHDSGDHPDLETPEKHAMKEGVAAPTFAAPVPQRCYHLCLTIDTRVYSRNFQSTPLAAVRLSETDYDCHMEILRG